MPKCVISYDLHKERNYQPLWDALRSWGAVKILESLWLLETSADLGNVASALRALVDQDDSFVLIELKEGAHWSSLRALPVGVRWLNLNIRNYPIAA